MLGLERKLAEWREAGVLDDEQVAGIRAHEQQRAGGVAAWQEAVGYLGATLALSAVALLLGELWEDLLVGAQIGLVAALTAALTLTGGVVPADREDALRRLTGVLLGAASATAAWLGGLVGAEVLGLDGAGVGILVGVGALTHGGVTWGLRRLPLQQVATYGGLWTTAVATVLWLDVDPGALLVGLVAWAVGLVWAVLVWGGIVRPVVTGYLLGGGTILAGAQVAAVDELRLAGLALGLVSTLAVLAAGARLGELVLLLLGAVGILVFVPQVVFELFADTVGAPITLLVTGVLIVAGAVGSVSLGREVLQDGSGQP